MGDSEENNKNKISEDFDIQSELSALAEKNVIPKRIAKRLGERLKEKNSLYIITGYRTDNNFFSVITTEIETLQEALEIELSI